MERIRCSLTNFSLLSGNVLLPADARIILFSGLFSTFFFLNFILVALCFHVKFSPQFSWALIIYDYFSWSFFLFFCLYKETLYYIFSLWDCCFQFDLNPFRYIYFYTFLVHFPPFLWQPFYQWDSSCPPWPLCQYSSLFFQLFANTTNNQQSSTLWPIDPLFSAAKCSQANRKPSKGSQKKFHSGYKNGSHSNGHSLIEGILCHHIFTCRVRK